MNAAGPRHLRQPLDAGLDFLACNHHQVGHLIDDDNDIGDRNRLEFVRLEHRIAGFLVEPGLDRALEHLALGQRLAHPAIVAFDVAHAHAGHLAIALFHLAHDPFQGDDGLLGVGDNRRQQVRNAVIDAEFQHLRVNHDHPAFFRRQLVQQGQDHRVDRHRLARSGRTGNQQVGHLCQVGHHRIAANVLAQRQGQAHGAVPEIACRQYLAQDHLFAVDVGQFNPDDRPPRHGGHAGRQRRHRPGDVIGQTDHAAGFQARGRFKFVHGHDRAGADTGDFALHAIVVQHRFQHAGVFLQRLMAEVLSPDGGWCRQQRQRRHLIGRGLVVKPQARLCFGHRLARGNRGFLYLLLHDPLRLWLRQCRPKARHGNRFHDRQLVQIIIKRVVVFHDLCGRPDLIAVLPGPDIDLRTGEGRRFCRPGSHSRIGRRTQSTRSRWPRNNGRLLPPQSDAGCRRCGACDQARGNAAFDRIRNTGANTVIKRGVGLNGLPDRLWFGGPLYQTQQTAARSGGSHRHTDRRGIGRGHRGSGKARRGTQPGIGPPAFGRCQGVRCGFGGIRWKRSGLAQARKKP